MGARGGADVCVRPLRGPITSEDPEREILAHGGRVFFAVLGDEVIGTCGLEQESKGVYAVIKMTVERAYRGLGVGRLLLERTLEEFQALGGKQLFLETNSALAPALHLYESVGFVRQKQPRAGTHFVRADVYMIYEPQPAAAATFRASTSRPTPRGSVRRTTRTNSGPSASPRLQLTPNKRQS